MFHVDDHAHLYFYLGLDSQEIIHDAQWPCYQVPRFLLVNVI